MIAIVGPTASGKTALSLALADMLEAEIVACDSRTIYRYMDIGTAKPSLEEQAKVPHHLLDVAEPDQSYTVAMYKQEASAAVDSILARGKYAIVCGGTGLYARALLEGLSMPAVPPQDELRQELNKLADDKGNQILHARLYDLDKATAERLNANDRFRIIRALEVCLTTGRRFSELATRSEEPYKTIWIGLSLHDRLKLKEMIAARFSQQMDAGLLDEVESLLDRYGETRALKNAVTYRDLINYIRGRVTKDEAMAECLKHNYQLARRQLMWFRANEKVNWFVMDQLSTRDVRESVLRMISESGS
ncbi:MAG TPA: tRNA (adenosine(37)-N6)-dimethylallyltransferase MiaA [Candidatus Obscuribacterales bacterium]